jgi:hypothetical protein
MRGKQELLTEESFCFFRNVVILRADETLDGEELAAWVGSDQSEIVVLSVGYPQTAAQRRGVEAALRFAADLRLTLEARLAWTMDEALDFLAPGDRVKAAAVEDQDGAHLIPAPARPGA